MKILHLCTSDNSGGAARAAYRLHAGLMDLGVDSKMFVKDKNTVSKSVIRYKYPKGTAKLIYRYNKHLIENEFKRYHSTRPSGFEVFSDDRSQLKEGFFNQLPDADIYHLHWTSRFIDLPSFFRRIKKPVVWTLHDMFPFTGGCHYNSGCENYFNHCQKCPQLGSVNEKDLSYNIWERKHSAINGFSQSIKIRADSRWLADEARKSSLFRKLDIETIHYGLEADEFIPRDKKACRRALNIPDNFRVVVYGAPGIDNPRKGYRQLDQALKELKKIYPDLFLLSFGAGEQSSISGINGLHLGYVLNNHLLSIIYNCADVFVIPSLQEAFGQTALEAMSCEVPVAGFDTGGIPDMVEDGITGFLAETENSHALADSIRRILELSTNEYNKMASNCRNKVLSGFTISHQAEKYNELYNKLAKLPLGCKN